MVRQAKQRMTIRRRFARIAALLVIVLAVLGGYVYAAMVWMPGRSFDGPLPPMTEAQQQLADELRGHVEVLADDIGPRNVMYPRAYEQARTYLGDQLRLYGYDVTEHTFIVNGVECANVIAELPCAGRGSPRDSADSGAACDEIIVVGAHYDSCYATPAANDNGSGCAATLALAKRFADRAPQRTVRFVLFANEEPPQFLTDDMGSLVYARACRDRGDKIIAMLSLETIGCYSDEPDSQRYPIKPLAWFYPTRGDFIAFVGNLRSRSLTRRVVGSFRRHASFPSQGAALPGWIPGVGWSDHWAFWQAGYPAVMVTDTAPFRYPHYHEVTDTPNKLDYQRMARVVDGLEAVIIDLAGNSDLLEDAADRD